MIMSAECDARPVPPPLPPSSPPMLSSRLLEKELGACIQTRGPVPDHLSQTRYFSNVQENSSIKTKPQTIHFHGYKTGRLHQQTIHIINASNDNVSLHIVPPSTHHFTIDYHKTSRHLVPGLSLKVTLSFRPSEWKHYHDCIRIHSKDANLLIPINAYPVLNISSFPRSVMFRPTPVGQTRTHDFILDNLIPVDFQYSLTVTQPHPALSVSPMSGIVSGNNKEKFAISFSPMEYSTATMKFKLDVVQFNFQPLICTVTGNAVPGLALEQYKIESTRRKAAVNQAKEKTSFPSPSPPPPSTSASSKRRKLSSSKSRTSKSKDATTEYEGIHFPPNLNTPTAVAKVLAQKPGVMTVAQLKTATTTGGASGSSYSGNSSYQLKEAVFLQKVKENDEEEKANRIRWVKHIGSKPLDKEGKEAILRNRLEAQKRYQVKYNLPDNKVELGRLVTELNQNRTLRKVKEIPQYSPSFNTSANNEWEKRHRLQQRFIKAANSVIVRNRCQRKLELLRRTDLKAARERELSAEISSSTNLEQNKLSLEDLSLSLSPPIFPNYIERNKSAEKLSFTPVTVQPNKVDIKPSIPLLDLKVPSEHRLLGYSTLTVPPSIYYMPLESDKELLTGAQEECSLLTSLPELDLSFLWKKKEEGKSLVDEIRERMVPFDPPTHLFEHKIDQPFHIFNPCPEVVSGLYEYLPNSEVTFEHHLLPLSTGSDAPHPQPKLDPYDGIPGIMKWKDFPSPFLATMEGQKTLSSRWRPCLSDPFSTDLLPLVPDPPQLDGPQQDDLETLDCSESSDPLPRVTEEMLRAEFYIPDTTDEPLCTRQMHEEQLEAERKNSLDHVGKQYQRKHEHLLSLFTNKNKIN